jgi:hypothetical protein
MLTPVHEAPFHEPPVQLAPLHVALFHEDPSHVAAFQLDPSHVALFQPAPSHVAESHDVDVSWIGWSGTTYTTFGSRLAIVSKRSPFAAWTTAKWRSRLSLRRWAPRSVKNAGGISLE